MQAHLDFADVQFWWDFNVAELIMIHGLISRCLIRLFLHSSWDRPAPHLLHTCLASAPSSAAPLHSPPPPRPPNRLLYDPCPMAGGRHSWSQWRCLRRGPHKIIPPHHGGPSARHSCCWTLGNPGTGTDPQSLLLLPHAGASLARFDVREILFAALRAVVSWCYTCIHFNPKK